MDSHNPSQPSGASRQALHDAAPPQTAEQLTDAFGLPGVLSFAPHGELLCAEIATPAATAVLALQGAHLVSWKPAGQAPVLFLSERSEFLVGRAIRGGIPVIWPWFGARSNAVSPAPASSPKSPSHGLARTSLWRLRFAALSGEDLHLSLSLEPSPETRSLGFDAFRLVYQLVVGRSLSLRLTVGNDGPEPLRFEEAFHSYFAVQDVQQAQVHGLENTEYLDKRDDLRRKREGTQPLQLSATTDRIYLATERPCTIEDTPGKRRLAIEKSHSRSTVVWNPWAELARDLSDMAPDGWRSMLCVETANVGEEAITLNPGEAHTMTTSVRVEPLSKETVSPGPGISA